MMDVFLFVFYFVGLFIAVCQDLKRREIDDWLNLLLGVGGGVFLVYGILFGEDLRGVFVLLSLVVVVFCVQMFLYKGGVFAGGDAKLLFAMTPIFFVGSFRYSMISLGVFLLLLSVVGAFYGLVYVSVLYVLNFNRVNFEMKKYVSKVYFKLGLCLGVVCMFGGLFSLLSLLFGAWLILLVSLYVFVKGIENVVMVRRIDGKMLMEGDWLAESVEVDGRVIGTGVGLSGKDVLLLRGKRVLIKDGIPFAPVFAISFLLFFLLDKIGFAEIVSWII